MQIMKELDNILVNNEQKFILFNYGGVKMNKGMLISFEGQDACGKSALTKKIGKHLESLGYKIKIVGEFSESDIGKMLKKKLAEDKFLRSDKKLGFSDTMSIITDLYYLQEAEIQPALKEGYIVLKDRHIDTIFACELPKVKDSYPEKTAKEIYDWLNNTSKNINQPDLTFLLTLPREVQINRIRGRGEEVSKEDLKVFDIRDKIYKNIANANKGRMKIFDNSIDIDSATKKLVNEIINKYKEFSKDRVSKLNYNRSINYSKKHKLERSLSV